jgi:hypothetical protein
MLAFVAGCYDGNIENNIKLAEEHSIKLIEMGFAVFTPHKNFAHYEKYESYNKRSLLNRETWLKIDREILRRCDFMYLLPNWKFSVGTRDEMLLAKALGLPIIRFDETERLRGFAEFVNEYNY